MGRVGSGRVASGQEKWTHVKTLPYHGKNLNRITDTCVFLDETTAKQLENVDSELVYNIR